MKAESAYYIGRNNLKPPILQKCFGKPSTRIRGTLRTNIGAIVKNNIECTTDIDKANTLNTHFAKIGSELHTTDLVDDTSQIYRVTPIGPYLKFDQHLFEKAFRDIKIGKASGPDNVKSNYLKARWTIVRRGCPASKKIYQKMPDMSSVVRCF